LKSMEVLPDKLTYYNASRLKSPTYVKEVKEKWLKT
jgi:hypothetical protein